MKTRDFLKKHRACADGAKWALSISDEEAQKLIDADDCDADFGVYQIERAGK
jgi:hypothetical protein